MHIYIKNKICHGGKKSNSFIQKIYILLSFCWKTGNGTMGVLFFFSGKTQSCLTGSHYWCEVHKFTWRDVVIYLRKQWWTSSGRICSSQGGSHLCHFESKKKKAWARTSCYMEACILFFTCEKIIAALWRKGHEKARDVNHSAQLEFGLRPRGQRRKTKLKFKRKTSKKRALFSPSRIKEKKNQASPWVQTYLM